ncbi:MAG: S8 family peptidase [Candidatus Alcyoniella australis]|nr:S8 family peptidase [Candidatus Alcyoniella australis]
MQQQLLQAWKEADNRQAVSHADRDGAYIEFESSPGFDLVVRSLERIGSGIRLLNVRKEGTGTDKRTLATVYVPYNKRGYFLRKIIAYAKEDTKSGKPKNAKLIESISDIRHAVLESFWRSDERGMIPGDIREWTEAWISSDSEKIVTRFHILLSNLQIEQTKGTLKFPERTVKLILANRHQLEQIVELSDDLAEFRAAKEVASAIIDLQNQDQVQLVQDLLSRTRFRQNAENCVCILDTGVNNGHLLINPVLDNADLHSANPTWDISDDRGHGTLMAGIISYGDLLSVLNSNGPLIVDHCLESSKILPPPPDQNPKKLWGDITSQGISRAEIQAPQRKRIFCMAVTSTDDRDRGRPSSWSAIIDKLTSGYEDDTYRFIIISAGNVDNPDNWRNYPEDNLTNEVHDPGQAWNALTVGSFTEKDRINDPMMGDYAPIAPNGGLSPYSTTSTSWPTRKWPIKPDVVFEGGNVARGPNNSIYAHDDLQLLSTSYKPHIVQFSRFNATSASAALAAWMCAKIQTEYPEAWPETIRALIVHTAEWTATMKSQFLPNNYSNRKKDYAKLLRICGYGVPDLERALYCASNSLTLIAQAELQPFDKSESGGYITRDMHLYRLPWPTDILENLGGTQVQMRVTLSYFIEPGPGEVGWDDRYRYPSHSLRFAVNSPGELEDAFIKRINKQAWDEDGGHPGTTGPTDKWVIGDARNVGSIHSDIWKGTAADLADSRMVAIYPNVGWWRERHHLNRWDKRCRYSLIISIVTPEQAADIYIAVAQQIGVAIPIKVSVE